MNENMNKESRYQKKKKGVGVFLPGIEGKGQNGKAN